jgi:glycine cleavage system transcriptional repressor
MNTIYAVISAIGADRVGIVDGLSGLIAEAGANIEESKMAVLGGEFAVMMLVSLKAKDFEGLVANCKAVETGLGLRVEIKPTAESSAQIGGRPYGLETVSLDGQGIVHAVSAVLHRFGVNIEELETRTEGAPLTGAPMFHLRAGIVVGPGVAIAELRRALEELHPGQDLDIALTPIQRSGRD